MTSWAHGLTGVSLSVLVAPGEWSRGKRAGLALLFVGLAELPDIPLPVWGHAQYAVSHSLFVNLGLAALAALAFARLDGLRRYLGGWRVFGAGIASWMSHFVLDAAYNHGKGVAIFWPLSDARLALPLPWFRTLPAEGWLAEPATTARIIAVETAFFGTLLVLCLVGRWWWDRRRGRPTRSAWPCPRA